MINLTEQALTVSRAVWRQRWLAVIVAWVVAVLGGGLVATTPERYEAQARIHVDTQTVLKPLMSGLAFQPDIDQQVRMLARTLISRPNVERLANDVAIGWPKGDAAQATRRVEELLKAIKVELSGGSNLYAITYRDSDAQRANRLVSALVGLFMSASTDTKRRDSEEASRFIDEQIKSYEAKLIESENRLKEFKLRNMNMAGTSNQDYFGRMSALTDEVAKIRLALSAAEQSRDALKRELTATEPQLGEVNTPGVVSLTPDLDARIDTQRRQLDDMLRRYTDEHPDVQSTRRTIKQLEDQRHMEGEAARSLQSPSRARAAAAAANPVFQRLRISLAEAEANIASLRGQLSTQQSRLEEIKAQAGRVPQAEAELAQLNRDYDIIRKNYEQLVSRREAASLGVKIDQQASLADFRIIEPPRVMPSPVFPSRAHLAVGVMLLAVLLGLGAGYAATLMRPTFSSERELREFTKRPVLGGLTKLVDPRADLLERQDRMRVMGAMGLFVLVHAGWVVWLSVRTGT
ncbi:XrtA system polysaccharide chain length determinant [Sphaerotilus microaerophilus]|uniref:Chain-length determining protein n=1 Tax=Sphaerotilus microaerophilus TaxID=2914710 RepID=A0ABM7YIK9_9BURK|nr:XrtA system polysaccharide chain length determinant [Sphaerotilus sp. FB-5]BDI04103.1 chain-length determining protein [Sphaerotilus sp. FB-5]